jgi:hypothetical protein
VTTARSIATLAAAVIAAAALAGCADRTTAADRLGLAPSPAASKPSAGARSSYPYALYTHCGISEANIAGHWYAADTPLSDGNGNPPPGWGNPYQPGIITIRSATQADFTDGAGHHVAFTLRPAATGPLRICS